MTQGKIIAFGAGAVSTLLLKNEKTKKAVDKVTLFAAKGASKILDGIEALSKSESAKNIRAKASSDERQPEIVASKTTSKSANKAKTVSTEANA